MGRRAGGVRRTLRSGGAELSGHDDLLPEAFETSCDRAIRCVKDPQTAESIVTTGWHNPGVFHGRPLDGRRQSICGLRIFAR
jgi:hypothetical protein